MRRFRILKTKKAKIRSIVDSSSSRLKSNVNVTPDGWMMEEHDVANQLKIPDNVKRNMDEIMNLINENINIFDNTDNSDDVIDINNDNEIEDMYIEDDYLNETENIKDENQMDDIKITNINDSWEINEESKDFKIIQVNPLHPRKRLKRKANRKDDCNKVKIRRVYVDNDGDNNKDREITKVQPQHPRDRLKKIKK